MKHVKPSINWIEEDNLRPGFGHGVEFYFSPIKTLTDNPIAIIEGFDWLHKADCPVVNVKILPSDSGKLANLDSLPEKIIQEVKSAANQLLSTKSMDRTIFGNILVHFNA